jgi:preprotein translocase subunit YajC
VITTGGTLGKVTAVGETFVTVEVATGVEVKVQRSAIQALMPKGTIKAA